MARWSLDRRAGGSRMRSLAGGAPAPQTEALGILVGRILLALIFIISGLHKLFDFTEVSSGLAAQGIAAAGFFLVIALLVELIFGLGVLFGVFARASALILALYLIPVTLIFHDFWSLTGPSYMAQFFSFWKNVAIAGGLILVASAGPGEGATLDRPEPVTSRDEPE